ncbi:MAG: polysaccharide deacetylase family protein [Bacteroidetes bacterium]|nr:polysaccharide deacetylase family protein [Bacteroidota bacterium]
MKRNLIINFHVVNDAVWFESVILLLKAKYTLVHLSFFENSNNYEKGKGFCHISFDDGDQTFYTVAYPILKKHDVPATLFVSPKSAIRRENFWFQEVTGYDNNKMITILSRELSLPIKTIHEIPFFDIMLCLPLIRIQEIITFYQKETDTLPKHCQNMSLDEILEVEKSGLITVGAHTLNHPILKNENDEICHNEITGSIIELQKLLGHKVSYFAYPNGMPYLDFGEREINCLMNNNIIIAVSTEAKFISKHDNKLTLPRLGLSYGSMRFVELKLILGANWEKIKSLKSHSESKNRQKITSLLEKVRKNEMK